MSSDRVARIILQKRMILLFFLVFLGSLALTGRLVYIQLFQSDFFQTKAMEQRLQPIPVDATRGTIYDRNGVVMAMSVSANAVYAIPAEVKDPEKTATQLAEILDVEYDRLLRRLTRRSASEWLKKRVSTDTARQILALNLPGIGVVENPQRFYPNGSIAPQVLGIVGYDNQGLEGLELYYDQQLKGIQGEAVFERDAVGREIPGGVRGYTPGKPGADLVLTIDYYIQQIAEREVERAVRETGSRLAVIVIMSPKTGEILATAVYPSYDIMNYQDYPLQNRRNIAVTDTYEPGSTFKAVTAAIALEEGVANMHTHFFDPGYIRVSGWTIRCWNRGGHGSQSFVETLENSCNPFYAKLGMELGGERFYHKLREYNFGSKLGVDFPGEAPGRVREPSNKIPLVTWANIGFGQGMTLTPIQLMAAFSAIANDGILSIPHYVREIRTPDGETIVPFENHQRRIISSEVAAQTRDALRSVIANGSGRRADVEGYRVAGKTGTAQLVEGGRYSHSKTVTSFAGFAPADDPEMAGMIVMWEPQGAFFGGIIAAPVFARLAEQILPYMGVERRESSSSSRDEQIPTKEIPDVSGLTVDQAVKILEKEGFKPEIIGEGSRIVGQVPAAHAEAERGTVILIYTDVDYLETTTELPVPFGV